MLSKVTKINFLLKIAIDNQEKGYEKGKYFSRSFVKVSQPKFSVMKCMEISLENWYVDLRA